MRDFSKEKELLKGLNREELLHLKTLIEFQLTVVNNGGNKAKKVIYNHDCNGSSNYHFRKCKHWCKLVTAVDDTKLNGYAFKGEFLSVENENLVPVGSIIVEVCDTKYKAYKIIEDVEDRKEFISEGRAGSLHSFIVELKEYMLNDNDS